MTRMFKILSAAALALLAIGALSIATASAASFHSEKAPVKLTAEQDATEGSQKFVAAGSTITCTEARFESTSATTTTEELTFKPLLTTSGKGTGYSGCTFFGVGVTVNMHTCDFVFHSNGLIDVAGCGTSGENYISFKATVLGASCEVRVKNQTGLTSATYTNIGSGTTREVTTDVAVNSGNLIDYDAIGSLCNPAGLGQTNGTYNGKVTVTGEEDPGSNHIGTWWE